MTSFNPSTPRREAYARHAAENERKDRSLARYIQRRLGERTIKRARVAR